MMSVSPMGRPTVATVSLANLRYNYGQIRSILPPGQKIWGIVKANAYGHGSVGVSQALVEEGCDHLAVATPEEGVLLRQNGIHTNIYVLDGILGDFETYVENRLVPVLHTRDGVRQVLDFARRKSLFLSVCLKFDTGMGRLGMFPDELDDVLKWLKVSPLTVDTVLTHLARADEKLEFTREPYARFHQMRSQFSDAGLKITKFSICNSASILDRHFDDFDFVRPGIALYGAYPHERQKRTLNLKAVMNLTTRIMAIKNYEQGASLGYGGTFVTQRPTKIAMLPLGYADGYPRLLSNTGFVLIKGRRAPVVGHVSMDLMAVDVTDIHGVVLNDEVVLFGTDDGEEIRVEEVAAWAQTISYEILTGIQERVPRLYV